MKKQNVNNKLTLGKATVTELNDNQLQNINGGTFSSSITLPLRDYLLDLFKE